MYQKGVLNIVLYINYIAIAIHLLLGKFMLPNRMLLWPARSQGNLGCPSLLTAVRTQYCTYAPQSD